MCVRLVMCLKPYFSTRGWSVPLVESPGWFSAGEAAITTDSLCKINQCAAGRCDRQFCSESHFSLKLNCQRWCCYTVFSPSAILITTPHSQSYRSCTGGKHLALPHQSICLAAAHHHSCHRRSCRTLPAVRKTGEPAGANTVHQLWRAKLSGVYQLCSLNVKQLQLCPLNVLTSSFCEVKLDKIYSIFTTSVWKLCGVLTLAPC